MEVPRGIRFSRGWGLRGRRILEGGEQRQVRRGVPEGGQARSMEVVLKVGGLNLGVLGGSPGLSGWENTRVFPIPGTPQEAPPLVSYSEGP